MAIDLKTLLAEASCMCPAGGSTAERTIMALLQRIAEAGGGGGGGTPSLPLNSVQFNDGGAFGGDADLTWNKTTNALALVGAANSTPLTISGYSLTGANAQSLVSLAGTWNTSGNPVGIRLAITDTASGATAKFVEFLGGVGGVTSLFSVSKAGMLVVPNITAAGSGGSSFSRLDVTGDFIAVPMGASNGFFFSAGPRISGTTADNIRLINSTVNGFGLLQFGGTTAAEPALKRSTTILQARLADDSAFTNIQAILQTSVNATAAAPPVTTHTIPITDAAGVVYRVPCLV